MIKQIIKFLKWVKYLFWTKPTAKPEPPKATDVIQNWIIVDYHGQKINLHKNELKLWEGLSRADKRAMALRFKTMEKKGEIRFEVINGKEICIRNKDYANKTGK
jgi:hypothetical protein